MRNELMNKYDFVTPRYPAEWREWSKRKCDLEKKSVEKRFI